MTGSNQLPYSRFWEQLGYKSIWDLIESLGADRNGDTVTFVSFIEDMGIREACYWARKFNFSCQDFINKLEQRCLETSVAVRVK